MKKRSGFFRLLILGFLLMLVSCSLPQADPVTVESATEPAAAGEAPVFEPASGAIMGWWDGSNMVYVPGGDFLMGDQDATSGDNIPAHTVSLESFWIQKVEVTNEMYARCVELGICAAPQTEAGQPDRLADPAYADHPVVNVNWEDADTYCTWIGGRLPSEAEWEKTARGTEGDPYPWGEDPAACSLLNYGGCQDPPEPMSVGIHTDGYSPYEAADMAGNVAEWTADWFAPDYYASSPASNPTGPADGDFRVVRGSSYLSNENSLYVHQRFYASPETARPDLGFRCILTGETLAAPPAPLCQMAPYDPNYVPYSEQDTDHLSFGVDAVCATDPNGNVTYSAIITSLLGDDIPLTVTSPEGNIQCTRGANDQFNDPQWICTGSALQPGEVIHTTVCGTRQDAPVVYGGTGCPAWYSLNPTTGLCEYTPWETQGCPPGTHSIPGYLGCHPDPVDGSCPSGYYEATYNQAPVCIPAGGPTCAGLSGCMATCPSGLTFNEDLFCCDYPEDLTPFCPPGYVWNMGCGAQLAAPQECYTFISDVPDCSVPPPDSGGGIPVSCSSFTNQTSCEANSCKWYVVSDTFQYCDTP